MADDIVKIESCGRTDIFCDESAHIRAFSERYEQRRAVFRHRALHELYRDERADRTVFALHLQVAVVHVLFQLGEIQRREHLGQRLAADLLLGAVENLRRRVVGLHDAEAVICQKNALIDGRDDGLQLIFRRRQAVIQLFQRKLAHNGIARRCHQTQRVRMHLIPRAGHTHRAPQLALLVDHRRADAGKFVLGWVEHLIRRQLNRLAQCDRRADAARAEHGFVATRALYQRVFLALDVLQRILISDDFQDITVLICKKQDKSGTFDQFVQKCQRFGRNLQKDRILPPPVVQLGRL